MKLDGNLEYSIERGNTNNNALGSYEWTSMPIQPFKTMLSAKIAAESLMYKPVYHSVDID